MSIASFENTLVWVRSLSTLFLFGIYFLRSRLPSTLVIVIFSMVILGNGIVSGLDNSSQYRSLLILVLGAVLFSFAYSSKGSYLILVGVFIGQFYVCFTIYDGDWLATLGHAVNAVLVAAICIYPINRLQQMILNQVKTLQQSLQRIDSLQNTTQDCAERNDTLTDNFRQFIYAISHDLRTPIRAISGFTRMLASDSEGKLSTQEQLYLSRIEAASARLNGMVERLTQLSRLQTSVLVIETIDVSKLLIDLSVDFRKTYTDTIEFDIDPKIQVRSDRDELTLLFRELIDNACKNLRPDQKGTIVIKQHRSDTGITITVQDNGVGIENQHDLESMMKLFRTIHAGETSDGVGLSIASFIVEKMNGRLSASSPGENQGATLSIQLPISD